MQKFTEQTFVAIKTDGVQRALIGEIIKRFERASLKITALKMFVPDAKRAEEHYGKDDAWYQKKGDGIVENMRARGEEPDKESIEYGRDLIRQVVKYFAAGPVVGLVIEGPHAVAIVKKLVGGTEPLTTDVGTIRADFTLDSYQMANLKNRGVRNLIHCSDEPDEAKREINLWFNPEEIISYRHISEAMLHDIDLDGYME